MKYRLGIDLGTSYFKFGLFDEDMNMKGLSRIEVLKEPGSGNRRELPVERFRSMVIKGIGDACAEARTTPAAIQAAGYSSQANSFVLLDENEKTLTPLILWNDLRAGAVFPELRRLWSDPAFPATTAIGVEPSPNLCINKLLWFRKNHPVLWANVRSVMTMSDYLVDFLTGEKCGDLGTASLLGLLDCREGFWWPEAFEALGLDENLFIEKKRPGVMAGVVTAEVARLTGMKQGVPLYTGSLDHYMAALGAGAGKEQIIESTGTVVAVANFTGEYNPRNGICMSPWSDRRAYCQLAFDGNGAASLEWYRRKFASKHTIRQLLEMAEQVNATAGLTAAPMAFACDSLSEAFTGISGRQSHGHFICALLESTAHTLKALIERLQPGRKPARIISTGGGAKSPFWLKLKSEIAGIPFIASGCAEAACKGAAVITGTGVNS